MSAAEIPPQAIKRPLDGFLVLDMGQIYNGPYAGLQLSFMGARVIKIEPPEGDVLRRRKRETEPYPLVMLNSNKESVVLDLKQPRAREIFLALVAQADVLIENFAAGVMDRLGLGYDVLSKLNPRLVYGGSSGFGLDGPYRDLAAMDVTIQAMSGITNATGDADGPPTKAGAAVCDFLAGIHLCAGILGAMIGLVSGFVRPLDAIVMRAMDGLMSIPQILLAIALMALTRAYRDSEMVISFSSGRSLLDWTGPVLGFVTPVALLVALVAFIGGPWATLQSNEYQTRFSQREDISRVSAGQFRESASAGRVFYVESLNDESTEVRNVFVSQVDHRNLNLEVPFLAGTNPTSENIILACWRRLEPALRPGRLSRLRLWETENNYVEYDGR